MRVRGLHAQNQPVAKAWAGQRIALNIVGDAQKEDLNRGDWLLSDDGNAVVLDSSPSWLEQLPQVTVPLR